jgi:hypothetical protein
LPLIPIARFTGLVGVVELLMLEIAGTGGGGVLLPPPPQPAIRLPASARIAVVTTIIQALLFIIFSTL